jgi:hypothetical protein
MARLKPRPFKTLQSCAPAKRFKLGFFKTLQYAL